MKPRLTKEEALRLFRAHGGVMRLREAQAAGIHPATLYRLRDQGTIRVMARGLYCLADLPPQVHPDLVAVSRKVPRAVICLVSALAFHELTAEVPHAVECALPRGMEPPRLDYPPLRVYWFGPAAYAEGIEPHVVDGTTVRVYSPEKALADCFKYRKRLGMDTVLDALRRYRAKYGLRAEALMRCARICRVQNVMRPYLEATL
jgi:predicted transcriptional regulator of viral defense system